MPVYKEPTEQGARNVPPGEYTFTVTSCEVGISKGQKTSGSDAFKLVLTEDTQGVKVFEQLIDHPSSDFKFFNFLKSCNVVLKPGEAFDFLKPRADRLGIRWINPIGLRGRYKLSLVQKEKGEFNEVEKYIFGDPLPVESQPEPEADPDWD